MKRVTIWLIATLLTTATAAAQVVTAVSQKFQFMPSALPKHEVRDSTLLVANYHFSYPTDNFKDGLSQLQDDITVQLSPTMSKTFSRNMHLLDRNKSYGERNNVRFRLDYNDFEYFYDMKSMEYTVERRIPYSPILYGSTQVVEYTNPIEIPLWSIEQTSESLLGYSCMKATGRVGGRQWSVWFTTEIPAIANLWLFGGLPGLVLKAEDSQGLFRFECYSVRQTTEPICYYRWQPTKMSKTEWLETEKKIYSSPRDYFSLDGGLQVIGLDSGLLQGEWSVRYAPLELE